MNDIQHQRVYKNTVQIELTSGELPWKNLEDTVAICNAKEKSRTTGTVSVSAATVTSITAALALFSLSSPTCLGLKELFAGCPKEYIHMMFYIDSLKYYDKPNYAVLRGLLRDALDSNALSEYPYDWEANAAAQKPGLSCAF